jgi:hypothetical protein
MLWHDRIRLYGCETWFVTLREESEFFYENKMFRKVPSPKDKESEHFKMLPKDELGELRRSSGIVRIMNLSYFD